MAEEWLPLFTYILYNIAHRLQARKKRWMLGCKHDSLPCLQIFDTLFFAVSDLSSLLCHVVDSLTSSFPVVEQNIQTRMNNWWSHFSTGSLLWSVAQPMITLLLYKEMRLFGKREVPKVQMDKWTYIQVSDLDYISFSWDVIFHPFSAFYRIVLSHAVMKCLSCTVTLRGSGLSVVSDVCLQILRL